MVRGDDERDVVVGALAPQGRHQLAEQPVGVHRLEQVALVGQRGDLREVPDADEASVVRIELLVGGAVLQVSERDVGQQQVEVVQRGGVELAASSSSSSIAANRAGWLAAVSLSSRAASLPSERLAGDLLHEAGGDLRVASGRRRASMTSRASPQQTSEPGAREAIVPDRGSPGTDG